MDHDLYVEMKDRKTCHVIAMLFLPVELAHSVCFARAKKKKAFAKATSLDMQMWYRRRKQDSETFCHANVKRHQILAK